MSTNTNTTKRDDVRAVAVATRAALEGYKREVVADIDRLLALLSEAEHWVQAGGRTPRAITRFIRLRDATDRRCANECSDGCKHREAYRELAEHYYSHISDLDGPVFTVFEMVAGSGPDLDDAMDDLSRDVGNAINNTRVNENLMTQAYAAAGYMPPACPIAEDEPEAAEALCGAPLRDGSTVVDLEDARMQRDIAEIEARSARQHQEIDELLHRIERLGAHLRPRSAYLTLVSNNANPSGDSPNAR